MLVTRGTPVRRAKFPSVDTHGHQDLTIAEAEVAAKNTRRLAKDGG